MRIHELCYYTIDMTEEEKDILKEACLFYCESMQGNMTGEDDLTEATYEAYENLDETDYHYLDLECYHNALSYWLDMSEEDPNADPTAYWKKRETVDKLDEVICNALY